MTCDTNATDCPICMEVIQANINLVITECGHTFHARCLLTNIVHNGFGCPYCRTEMIPEELLQEEENDEEDHDHDMAIIEDDEEDEEGRQEDRDNWLTAPLNDRGVTIRRARMNQLRMYDRAHSTMRLMFARLEDNEDAEPEDVDFEDYSTIASDNYSFDEEDDEDYTDSGSSSGSDDSDNDSGSDSDSESENGSPDEVGEESARAMANHLPTISQISYSLERAEYCVEDFVRIMIHNEYPQYYSIIEGRRAQSTHRTVTRLISRIISRYQDRIYPTSYVNTIDGSIIQRIEQQGIEQTHTPLQGDDENGQDEGSVVWDETQIRIHTQIGIDLD